jgi:hypothetical protein
MSDKYNFITELMIEIVCFYVGVILFIGICMIPPLTIILPYSLPVTFLICIVMNIGFIIRFVKGTQKDIEKKYANVQEYVAIL